MTGEKLLEDVLHYQEHKKLQQELEQIQKRQKEKRHRDIINFLKEYDLLCKKYKMGLNGCGCCGSPYLIGTNMEEDINNIYYEVLQDSICIDDKTIDEYFKESE